MWRGFRVFGREIGIFSPIILVLSSALVLVVIKDRLLMKETPAGPYKPNTICGISGMVL